MATLGPELAGLEPIGITPLAARVELNAYNSAKTTVSYQAKISAKVPSHLSSCLQAGG